MKGPRKALLKVGLIIEWLYSNNPMKKGKWWHKGEWVHPREETMQAWLCFCNRREPPVWAGAGERFGGGIVWSLHSECSIVGLLERSVKDAVKRARVLSMPTNTPVRKPAWELSQNHLRRGFWGNDKAYSPLNALSFSMNRIQWWDIPIRRDHVTSMVIVIGRDRVVDGNFLWFINSSRKK